MGRRGEMEWELVLLRFRSWLQGLAGWRWDVDALHKMHRFCAFGARAFFVYSLHHFGFLGP